MEVTLKLPLSRLNTDVRNVNMKLISLPLWSLYEEVCYLHANSNQCLNLSFKTTQALHGLAPKCRLINMHELINKSTNDYVTLLHYKNGANVNNKG